MGQVASEVVSEEVKRGHQELRSWSNSGAKSESGLDCLTFCFDLCPPISSPFLSLCLPFSSLSLRIVEKDPKMMKILMEHNYNHLGG